MHCRIRYLAMKWHGDVEGPGIPSRLTNTLSLRWDGGPGRSRTADQRFRKPLLYPTELRGRCEYAHYLTSI
jgi:hypothetical protein